MIGETLTDSEPPKSRYTWVSEGGKGGLGKVWRARDNDLARGLRVERGGVYCADQHQRLRFAERTRSEWGPARKASGHHAEEHHLQHTLVSQRFVGGGILRHGGLGRGLRGSR